MNSWIRIRIRLWILWINELDSEYEFCELVNYNQNQDQNLNSVKRDHRVVQESPVLASASHDITNVAQASVQASELEPHSSHNGMDFFTKKTKILKWKIVNRDGERLIFLKPWSCEHFKTFIISQSWQRRKIDFLKSLWSQWLQDFNLRIDRALTKPKAYKKEIIQNEIIIIQ